MGSLGRLMPVRELGEEMARRGERGLQLEPGQGEGPGCPPGSGQGSPPARALAGG